MTVQLAAANTSPGPHCSCCQPLLWDSSRVAPWLSAAGDEASHQVVGSKPLLNRPQTRSPVTQQCAVGLNHVYICACAWHMQVIAGADKGTVAEVEKVIPTRGMIVVKGVNVKVSCLVLHGRNGLLVFLGPWAATAQGLLAGCDPAAYHHTLQAAQFALDEVGQLACQVNRSSSRHRGKRLVSPAHMFLHVDHSPAVPCCALLCVRCAM